MILPALQNETKRERSNTLIKIVDFIFDIYIYIYIFFYFLLLYFIYVFCSLFKYYYSILYV